MIEPLNMRDATYVLANLRADDRKEVVAQQGDVPGVALAQMLLGTPWAYQFRHRGVPVAIFGAHHLSASTVSAWALGTSHFRRAVPSVTRFVLGPLSRELHAAGYRWAEARSIGGHVDAHRWLMHTLRAEVITSLPEFGGRGEPFLLFRKRLSV